MLVPHLTMLCAVSKSLLNIHNSAVGVGPEIVTGDNVTGLQHRFKNL